MPQRTANTRTHHPMTDAQKSRTITLTARAPVAISEAEWPLIAIAKIADDSRRDGTPLPRHEYDVATCRVRQHADGRAIVYAILDGATPWTGTDDCSGGELLAAGADIPAAIARVCADVLGSCADAATRACVAALPATPI